MEAIHWIIKKLRQAMLDRQYSINETLAGKYKIKEVLRNGSYGIIYLCLDLDSGRKCVVKQMRKSKKKENEQNYKQETAILNMLNHSCIPKLMQTFTYQNNQFFSMEFIEGQNLESILFDLKKQYDEKDCLVLFKELATITCYIHGKGIVHGDIRIPNVIINKDRLYVIDFGLAHDLNTDYLNKETEKKLVQEDFYDLGEFLLFLLYSTYDDKSKKDQPWTEELILHSKTTSILKRLLQIDEPYRSDKEILKDIDQAIKNLSSNNSL
ncbi:serine/threonine protein kinase [Oceanobacillus halotolerans]|uniref:serine/threonine protein kinase n=1 Tax=Oceanobacillus halotolerans TaxID=2663380 RepID=UPI0013DC69D4|nr:protein kinase [Oceanobacillus halotolerans]